MATLKEYKIFRNFGTCYDDFHKLCFVKKGEKYDLVQFSLKEMGDRRYFWREHIEVAPQTSEDEVLKIIEDYIKTITKEEIEGYKNFLDWGEKHGWN